MQQARGGWGSGQARGRGPRGSGQARGRGPRSGAGKPEDEAQEGAGKPEDEAQEGAGKPDDESQGGAGKPEDESQGTADKAEGSGGAVCSIPVFLPGGVHDVVKFHQRMVALELAELEDITIACAAVSLARLSLGFLQRYEQKWEYRRTTLGRPVSYIALAPLERRRVQVAQKRKTNLSRSDRTKRSSRQTYDSASSTKASNSATDSSTSRNKWSVSASGSYGLGGVGWGAQGGGLFGGLGRAVPADGGREHRRGDREELDRGSGGDRDDHDHRPADLLRAHRGAPTGEPVRRPDGPIQPARARGRVLRAHHDGGNCALSRIRLRPDFQQLTAAGAVDQVR